MGAGASGEDASPGGRGTGGATRPTLSTAIADAAAAAATPLSRSDQKERTERNDCKSLSSVFSAGSPVAAAHPLHLRSCIFQKITSSECYLDSYTAATELRSHKPVISS